MGRICHSTQVKTGVIIPSFLPSFLASLLLSFLLHPPSIHLKPSWPSFQNTPRIQILLLTFTSTILGPATSIFQLDCNSGFLIFLPASLPVPFTFRTRVILINPNRVLCSEPSKAFLLYLGKSWNPTMAYTTLHDLPVTSLWPYPPTTLILSLCPAILASFFP